MSFGTAGRSATGSGRAVSGRAASGRAASSRAGDENQAARLKKPSWKDPRLIIGILLVLASVAGVVSLVRSFDRTTQVFSARADIAVGQQIRPSDVVLRPVRLGDIQSSYLEAAAGIPAQSHAQHLIRAGELIPKSALGTADALGRKPVGITVAEALPAVAATGSRVDVWISMPDDRNGFRQPELLLPGAEISELHTGTSALGAGSSTNVHVLVTDEQMPKLLAALANKAKLAVVWNPGGTAP